MGYRSLVFVFIALIVISSAFGISSDALRSHYGKTTVIMVQSLDPDYYAVSCGSLEVTPSSDRLGLLEGLGNPDDSGVPICVLNAKKGSHDYRAIIFSQDPSVEDGTKKVLAHFTAYKSGSQNSATIYEDNINENACVDSLSGSDWSDGKWHECKDPIKGVTEANKYHLYFRGGETNSYLFTWGFEPEFTSESFWDGIIDFFKGLFGIGGEGGTLTPNDFESFSGGYFAYAKAKNPTEVKAVYHADGATGSATVMLKNFRNGFKSLVAPSNYYLAHDNTQVLVYDDLSVANWVRLTNKLRIKGNNDNPLPGDVCGKNSQGDVILSYDEDCEVKDNNPEDFFYHRGRGSCEDLGYTFGTLRCNPPGGDNECSFDTSGCVQCEDSDGDNYPTAGDVPGGLVSISGKILIGSTLFDTAYNPDGSGEDSNFRALAGVSAQALPVIMEDFVSSMGAAVGSVLSSSLNSLSGSVNECSGTKGEYECFALALNSDEGRRAMGSAGFGGHVATMLSHDVSNTGAPCEFNGTWVCDSINDYMLGDFGRKYSDVLQGMASEKISPVMVIEPSLVPDNLRDKLSLSIYCGGLAYGINQIYASASDDSVSVDDFIFTLDPSVSGFSPDNYYQSYQYCRAGIKSVIPNAKLYYNLGRKYSFIYPLEKALKTHYDDRALLVDGLVVSDPSSFVSGNIVSSIDYSNGRVDYSGVDFARALAAETVFMPATVSEANLLYALEGNAHTLLFLNIKRRGSDDNLGNSLGLSKRGAVIKAIIDDLNEGIVFYSQKEKSLTKAQLLVIDDGSQKINYLLGFSDGNTVSPQPLGIDFSGCNGKVLVPDENGAFVEGPDLDENFKPLDGVQKIPLDDWSCYLVEGSTAGSCADWLGTTMSADCNDTNPSINPGASEVCGNGIDDDCDGVVDEGNCGSGFPPDESCDFDGICEDGTVGETPASCSDCTGMLFCPKAAVEAVSFNGYDFKVGFDSSGTPYIEATPSCEQTSGFDGEYCDWSNGHKDQSDDCDTKRVMFSYSVGAESEIMNNEGDRSSKVKLTETETGWKISYWRNNDDETYTTFCWGDCSMGSYEESHCSGNSPEDSNNNWVDLAEINFWDFNPCGVCPDVENVIWHYAGTYGSYTFDVGRAQPGVDLLRVSTACAQDPEHSGYGGSAYCELDSLKDCNDQSSYSLIFDHAATYDLYNKWTGSKCVALDSQGETLGDIGFCAQIIPVSDGWDIVFHDDGKDYGPYNGYPQNIDSARFCWGFEGQANSSHVDLSGDSCVSGCHKHCNSDEDCGGDSCLFGCCQIIKDSSRGYHYFIDGQVRGIE